MILAIFDLKFSQNEGQIWMCGLYQLLSTSRGYHLGAIIVPNFVRIGQVVGLEFSKNDEKMHVFRVKISHFQVIFRP